MPDAPTGSSPSERRSSRCELSLFPSRRGVVPRTRRIVSPRAGIITRRTGSSPWRRILSSRKESLPLAAQRRAGSTEALRRKKKSRRRADENSRSREASLRPGGESRPRKPGHLHPRRSDLQRRGTSLGPRRKGPCAWEKLPRNANESLAGAHDPPSREKVPLRSEGDPPARGQDSTRKGAESPPQGGESSPAEDVS